MTIQDLIEQFNNPTNNSFDELDVSSALIQLLPEDRSNIDEPLKAEIMAFDFTENYRDQKTGWGTYFGPKMVFNNTDGTQVESPSITHITLRMIDYWEKRAFKATNPILVSRYSGLVWDFKNKICQTHPSHEICRLYIKALIETANGDFHKYGVQTFTKLKRALNLAVLLNDDSLINQSKDALINFKINMQLTINLGFGVTPTLY